MTSSTPVQGVTTVYRTRSILGPLTTVFNAPPECAFAGVAGTPLSIGFRGQTCVGDSLADESVCWPAATAAAPSAATPLDGWGFYSPGISCPAGYTTACDATQGYRTGWEMQFTMEVGETAVGCCPTGFSCTKFPNGQTCISFASEVVQTASCSEGNFVSSDYATFPIVYTSTNAENSSTATLSRLPIAAPMIQLNWRSEDLATATGTGSTTSLPSETGGTRSNSSSSDSISPGAIAGAVIAGVVVLFAIAAAIFTFMRRRKARGNGNVEQMREDMMKPPQYGNQNGDITSASELQSSHGRPELSGLRNPSELSAHQGAVELPTSSYRPHSVQNQS